ncbi:MAG: tetratricopeptide repeat protein [Alicyclobacillus sp.]|nr:tetratricopeptide repeat protein [Alicyclobacillus sp.]
MQAINEGLQRKPDYGYGWFNKALALELYGHYDEAIVTYKKAIPLGTGQWWKAWAYYGIASIYGRRGDVANVATYLKQAEALSPSTKVAARTEQDFNPVRSSPVFQALLR